MIQGRMVPAAPTRSLQELILAAHFQAPLPLGIMDVADWAQHFAEYPIVQQLPIAPPMDLANPGGTLSLEFGSSGVTLPRILLRSADGRFTVQLQNDRFVVGWARIEPLGADADYPGFEEMIERWKELLGRFEAWALSRFQLRPQYRLAEVNYVNAMPLEYEGRKIRISEIFRFVQSTGRPLNMFAVNWAERIYATESFDPTRNGFVNVSVGLAQAPSSVTVLAFNFTGSAIVPEGKETPLIMGDIHDKIREIYLSAIVQNGD